MQTAIETTGVISGRKSLIFDEDIPVGESARVRVILFFDDTESGDITDSEWSRFLAKNEAFDFLADEGEDIYTLDDGEPYEI